MSNKKTKKRTIEKAELTFEGKKFQVWIDELTVDKAKLYLKNKHKKNRTLRMAHLSVITDLILLNHWDLNGIPLIFNERNELIDGQHRCEAVIKAGKSVATFCVSGVRSDSIFSIDMYNSRRQLKDLFQMNGETNATALAGTVSHFVRFKHNREGYTGSGIGQLIDKRQAVKILQKHPGLRDATTEAVSLYSKSANKIIGCGFLGYLIYMLPYFYEKYADMFIKILLGFSSSENYEQCPIYQCRRRIIKSKSGKKTERMTKAEREGMVIKTWNAYSQGKPQTSSKYLVWRYDLVFPKLQNEEGIELRYGDIDWE